MKKIKKDIIKTQKAPLAIGPYSQAIRAGNLLFLSGQISINPETKYLQDIKDFALVNKIYSI